MLVRKGKGKERRWSKERAGHDKQWQSDTERWQMNQNDDEQINFVSISLGRYKTVG